MMAASGQPSPEELANPFKAIQKKGKAKALKWCLWEVLKESQGRGMKVVDLVEQLDSGGLHQFKGTKNPAGQVRRESRFRSHQGRAGIPSACAPTPVRPAGSAGLPSPSALRLQSLKQGSCCGAGNCGAD